MAKFVTMAGNEIPLPASRDGVAGTRKELAMALALKYPQQVTLIWAGAQLRDTDELPLEGLVEVVTGAPPEGTWALSVWDASNFDEQALRTALEEGYPPPMGEAVIPEAEMRWSPSPHEAWAKLCSKQMQQATICAVGKWADYWSFGASADSYGYWMVKPPFIHSKDRTIDQVIADVKHWQGILLDLDGTFAQIQDRCKGMNVAETMEIAAAQLLRYSPQFHVSTSFKYGFETWYNPFKQVLKWFASFANINPTGHVAVDDAISDAVHGAFSSYTVRPDGAKAFAEAMARRYNIDIQDFDATEQWRQSRRRLEEMFEKERGGIQAEPCDFDAHFAFIREVDGVRSVKRAECMQGSLLAARAAAASKQVLTLEVLGRWNSQALDLNFDPRKKLRRTDAYAKKGRERYPHYDGLEADFEACLADAENAAVPPDVRAARVYLDVCFYHPFDDGNSRAARLALDFVLTKAGLCLRDASALFSIPHRADDVAGAKAFVEGIHQFLAPVGSTRDTALQQSAQKRDAELRTKISSRSDPRSSYGWFDCMTDTDFLQYE